MPEREIVVGPIARWLARPPWLVVPGLAAVSAIGAIVFAGPLMSWPDRLVGLAMFFVVALLPWGVLVALVRYAGRR